MAADEAFSFRPRLLLLYEVGAVHGNAAVRAFLHLQRQSYRWCCSLLIGPNWAAAKGITVVLCFATGVE
jgi:hypothetical protein